MHSLPDTLAAAPQFLRGAVPIFFRRSLRTASGLPQRMSQRCDVVVTKPGNAVFIHRVSMRLLGMLVSFLGVLQSLPGEFLPGLVILLFMSFRSAAMCVGRAIVQFGGSLMILVMRSVVISSRH